MNSLFERPEPKGHIKATVIRANGERFVHCDEDNTIQAGLKAYLAGALQANSTASLDNLFSSVVDPPTNGKDGIVFIKVPSTSVYAFKCTGTGVGSETLGWSGSAAARKLTAEFTGYAETIAATTNLKMGFNYITASWAFTTDWAVPGSWVSLTLAAADRLIIEWTITIN